MKVLITGGRDFTDQRFVFDALDEIKKQHGLTLLIHGDATGVDTLGKQWAEARGIPSKAFPVTKEDWKRLGKAAGPIRNATMLEENPAYVVVFPGGRGTANMRNQAQKNGVPVILAVKSESK